MIHTFSLPQLLLQSLTLNFDIRLFSPFISVDQQKGFGRWRLTIPVRFAPTLSSSASPPFTPQPPRPTLVCTRMSQFPAIASMGVLRGSGRVWPMPRPRVGSISAVGYQGLAHLSAHSPMRLEGPEGVQCPSAIKGSYFSISSNINYLHPVKLLAFMTKFSHNFF